MKSPYVLDDFPVVEHYHVHWGDMDAAQHVNNLVYLRWVESARIAFFRHCNIDISFSSGVGPILGWQDCKYIFPVTFPDHVKVGMRVNEILDDRLICEAHIYSENSGRLCAISKQSLIPYGYQSLQKVAIPDSWIKGIRKFSTGGK